jgi:hypothetical protein
MKYITIIESNNTECPNIGTIAVGNLVNSFKKAIESHFDAKLLSYSFIDDGITELDDCINCSPIDVIVVLDVSGGEYDYKVELSETWLYD